jgi:hypothetical protein
MNRGWFLMTRTQAEKLVERLKSACIFNRFDEPGVYMEYIRALARFDYDRMDEAIDAAIEDDSRNVPPISALIKKYRETTESRVNVKNEQYCDVCDDKGFVLMKEKDSESGLTYEYVLYCPFCNIGRAQAYDGRSISDIKHRSAYYVPPITEYFGDEGIEALRETNLKRRAERSDSVRLAKKELQTVGKSIPDGWQYDTDDVPF